MEAIGALIFILVMGMAWWMLVFLGLFMPYVATLLIVNKFNPKMANAMAIWK